MFTKNESLTICEPHSRFEIAVEKRTQHIIYAPKRR